MSEELHGLRQWLNSFKAGQNYQSQKSQVHAVDGLRGGEWDGQDEYSPHSQVHQQIVQRLLQACNQRHALLYLFESAVEGSNLLLLIHSSSTGQDVLHTLDTIYDLPFLFSPQRQLPLAQTARELPGQERDPEACGTKKPHRPPPNHRPKHTKPAQ